MSKTITVPDIGRFPIELTLNGVKYKLYPGTTVTVSDGVADLLERLAGSKPKEPPVPEALTEGDVQAMVLAALATVQEMMEAAMEAVQEMIDASTAPVTLDLSDEESGMTWDGDMGGYVGDETIDWSPLIESVKEGKVWLEDGSNSYLAVQMATDTISDTEYFVFWGADDSPLVDLPVPSEEGEGGVLSPLPGVPVGMLTLKLPTVSSGT